MWKGWWKKNSRLTNYFRKWSTDSLKEDIVVRGSHTMPAWSHSTCLMEKGLFLCASHSRVRSVNGKWVSWGKEPQGFAERMREWMSDGKWLDGPEAQENSTRGQDPTARQTRHELFKVPLNQESVNLFPLSSSRTGSMFFFSFYTCTCTQYEIIFGVSNLHSRNTSEVQTNAVTVEEVKTKVQTLFWGSTLHQMPWAERVHKVFAGVTLSPCELN